MNRKICQTILMALAIGVLTNSLTSANGLKPEIQHKFREPEKRPPIIVTTFFTLLVASPAVILFILWSRTVSLKFETLTLRRFIFHVLFLLVLACYARFWLGTNMFETMRYTVPLMCALFYVYK